MQQETCATLEDKLEIALGKVSQEGKGMECPFKKGRVYPFEFFSLFVQPVGCETDFSDHIVNPLTPPFQLKWN